MAIDKVCSCERGRFGKQGEKDTGTQSEKAVWCNSNNKYMQNNLQKEVTTEKILKLWEKTLFP